MGCDIHGWVEVKEKYGWASVICIDELIWRNYDMFGSLFGVRNYAGFRPIAPNRGFPEDASYITKRDYKGWGIDAHSATWITWKEIKEIDWEEEAEREDARIHVYKVREDGTLEYRHKFLWSSELTHEDYRILREKKELRKDNIVYKLEKIKRKDALSNDWKALFELMEVLAKRYGDENVRLVVWFDN